MMPLDTRTLQRTARCLLDEKMDLHKFQICRKNVKTEEYIWSKDGKRHKCSIYHICPRFALQFSEICDIFARSKLMQIHFFVHIDFLDLVVSNTANFSALPFPAFFTTTHLIIVDK